MILFLFLAAVVLYADPPGDRNWAVLPEFTDEFDGAELDAGKWWPNNPEWTGRQPGWFSIHNVNVSDGKLHLACTKGQPADCPSSEYTYGSAAVKSKNPVLYGYFELECKSMKSYASSAFWFYRNADGMWTEIDVFEMGGNSPNNGGEDRKYNMNVHVFTPTHWSDHEQVTLPFVHYEDYHVYGLDWNADSIVWYVDGEAVRTRENTHWHYPLTMNFDSEIFTGWFGVPLDEDLPSTFSIEYIRSWKESEAVSVSNGMIESRLNTASNNNFHMYDLRGRKMGSYPGTEVSPYFFILPQRDFKYRIK